MSAPKHTPGPLTIERCTRADYHLMDADGACVATVYLYDNDDEARANACLIAAAPELLEAAPDAADMLEAYAGYIRTVKADELERHPYLPELERVAEALRAAIAKATGQ